jgi:hypothetical protein
MRCRYARERRNWLLPFRRLRLIGTKFGRAVAKRMLNHVRADPVVEVVGCLNRGVETVLYRRSGRAMRSPGGPADCRHGDAPFELCFTHRSNRAAARASHVSSPVPRRLLNARPLSRVPTFYKGSSPRVDWKLPAALFVSVPEHGLGRQPRARSAGMEYPARGGWLSLLRCGAQTMWKFLLGA